MPPACQQRCAQCGRIGTRQFRTLPPGDFGGPGLTICTNSRACACRQPVTALGVAAAKAAAAHFAPTPGDPR